MNDDLISRQAATSIPILPKEHRKIFKSIDDAFETGWNEALSCVNILPSAQVDLITKIQNGIRVTDADDVYSCGMRNGMRWCLSLIDCKDHLYENCPSAHPEIIRCHQCRFWDRDTLHHNFNDSRDWNEAECLVLAERDPYDEINRYTEADDFCSKADRREE